MSIFKKNNYKIQLKGLQKSQIELSKTVDHSMELAEEEINSTRSFFEKMKNHGINRFDNLLNLCLYTTISNSDMILFIEKIRISKRRMEKLLFTRMLAMTVIEYLKDINQLLGFKLIGELNKNDYQEFVPVIKSLNSQFSAVKKKHGTLLTSIRNNISAHKTKDSLNLIHYIFSLDTDEIYQLTLEVININKLLTQETTKVYALMLDEAKTNEENSRQL